MRVPGARLGALLVEDGDADAESADRDGQTAFHPARENGYEKMVAILEDAGR